MHTDPIETGSALAASITRTASKQTYYTIRFLADRNLVDDAYRAYGYFRWLDDWLDQGSKPQSERLDFVARQQSILEDCYSGIAPIHLLPQEHLLAELIEHDAEKHSGLQAYIRNMMEVMAFDAVRRGRLITQNELNTYTLWLSAAVTEALHYFIGHGDASPQGNIRYLAVTGAHITHMLRDAQEDAEAGYFNIPGEVLTAHGISPTDIHHPAYREWVRENVHQAHRCFQAGRKYLAQVENIRCRMAGYAYIHRFEVVLKSIEREGFLLRKQYLERKSPRTMVEMLGWALWMALKNNPTPNASPVTVR